MNNGMYPSCVTDERQTCTGCYRSRPITKFGFADREHKHRRWKCNTCVWLERMYGMTYDEYIQLCAAQGFRCLGCKQIKKLFVEHSHKSARRRGLKCHNCNVIMGLAKDRPQVLRNLADYLEKNEAIDRQHVLETVLASN